MEETMAQAERRRMPTELSEESSGAAETAAAETAGKVVSAMTTSGDAWITYIGFDFEALNPSKFRGRAVGFNPN
jgi:hypothetical protein